MFSLDYNYYLLELFYFISEVDFVIDNTSLLSLIDFLETKLGLKNLLLLTKYWWVLITFIEHDLGF